MLRPVAGFVSVPILLVLAGIAVAAPTILSPQTIKTVFGSGAPFQSLTPSGTGFTFVLKPDGTASRTPKGSTAAVTGKWHVDAKGYCSKWGNNNENCFTVKQDGTKYTVLDSSGKAVAIWVPAAAPAAPAAAVTPAKPK
ncbi:hypothetical protein BH10PSE9_BH10PSE9_11430 [soil metagenome]